MALTGMQPQRPTNLRVHHVPLGLLTTFQTPFWALSGAWGMPSPCHQQYDYTHTQTPKGFT